MARRGIDHLVLASRNLDQTASAYQRLGFTVTPRAHHPFGTGNNLIQLDGNFVELLGVFEPEKIQPADGISFADFNRQFLETREGLSMLVLDSTDARADHAEFQAAGLKTFQPFDFSRGALQPDGSEATVAFSVCFVMDEAYPGLPMFVCQQHRAENFWHPDYQAHANGGLQIVEATVVADEPKALVPYYAGVFGADAIEHRGDGVMVTTGRGSIAVIKPEQMSARFAGVDVALMADRPYFAGYAVSVTDPEAAMARLADEGMAFSWADGVVRVDPSAAGGTVLELTAAAD